jgi:ActR/RegA family two-component response regulator
MNHSSEKWLLLLIDDDEEDYLITRDLLRDAPGRKISVELASTYESGLEKLRTKSYDAVLVDYELGTRRGTDLIREAVAACDTFEVRRAT